MCLLSLMRFFVLFPVTNKYALNSSATYHDRVVIMWWRSPPLLPLFPYFHAPSHTYREWNIEQLNYRLIMSCPHQPQKQKCQYVLGLNVWVQILNLYDTSIVYTSIIYTIPGLYKCFIPSFARSYKMIRDSTLWPFYKEQIQKKNLYRS